MTVWRASLSSLGLRGVTLGSKFILVLYLARSLPPEDLGLYGLLAATVTLGIYFLGADFSQYSTRELLARPRQEWARLLRDQLLFHLMLYAVGLPAMLLLFAGGLLPWPWLTAFYVLQVLEHMSQECFRVLVTISRPVMANVVLFVRSGAWVYAVISATLVLPGGQILATVIWGWASGAGLSIALAAWSLRGLGWRGAFRSPVDWGWIRTGARSALVLLGATLSFTALEYLDRYFIQYYHGQALLGVYTLYAQIANVIQTVVITGIFMIRLPSVVMAFESGNWRQFRQLFRAMGGQALAMTAACAIVAAVGIYPVLALVGNPLYAQYLPAYWTYVGGASLLIVSYLPHYLLYVQHQDTRLLLCSGLGLVVAAALNALLVPRFGLQGAALATLGAYMSLLLSKGAAVYRLPRRMAQVRT